jgi:hypothetical protein
MLLTSTILIGSDFMRNIPGRTCKQDFLMTQILNVSSCMQMSKAQMTKKSLCFKCWKKGHVAPNCSGKEQANSTEAQQHTMSWMAQSTLYAIGNGYSVKECVGVTWCMDERQTE